MLAIGGILSLRIPAEQTVGGNPSRVAGISITVRGEYDGWDS
jgi:hypothetical protein